MGVLLIFLDKPPERPKCKCGKPNTGALTPNGRIINGDDAVRNEFPWFVRLEVVNSDNVYFICGGTIISTRTILTAAHCVTYSNANTWIEEVVVADHDKSIDGDGEYYAKVCDQVPHSLYKGPRINPQTGFNYDYDVGIVTLCNDLKWSPQVSPICLPENNFRVSRNAIVAGWGSTQSKPDTGDPNILQKKTLYVMNEEDCESIWNDIGQRQICALQTTGNTCSGDSGGPLIEKKADAYTLVGILSYGETDCIPNITPDVFQRVSEYLPFIQDRMKGIMCDKGKFIKLKNKIYHFIILF